MSAVVANGLSFHVQELGAGPPLVMLHGLLIGSLASWYFTAAPTLAQRHRVRLFDLRGHGRSEVARDGYGVGAMAGDLEALVADLPGPIDLVGHSWGALVALRFALDHPARVRRLALVEAPLPPSKAGELTAFLDEVEPAKVLDALPEALRDAVAGGRRQAQRLLRSLQTLLFETSLLADLRAEPDLADDELATLACPTLCVYGDRSACRPAGERLARVVPGARLAVLPGGHYLHLDARAALTDALQEHLGG
ncbi:MAG: alpha/beta fold hydrolase [Kofleriaceae bacterium]|nr:alpha/beta fold hydrolase [Myxococcales bacterium]MCB9571781.1 alpha/beta fold hydrolase [Kofleriaceae bacterium]